MAGAALVLFALVCAALLAFPPETAGFYPVCPVYRYLHVLCPGCGATRALAALLHGRVADALRLNALFVAILPFAACYAALCCRRAWAAAPFSLSAFSSRWSATSPRCISNDVLAGRNSCAFCVHSQA
jgi:hypothetical protein